MNAAQARRSPEALRQRMPARVWKSAHGEYALKDAAMHRWFEKPLPDRPLAPDTIAGDVAAERRLKKGQDGQKGGCLAGALGGRLRPNTALELSALRKAVVQRSAKRRMALSRSVQ